MVENYSVNLMEVLLMKFIMPKNKRGRKVEMILSKQTRTILKYYSLYAEYSEDEIVDEFLKNLLKDEDFIQWLTKRRYNKRIVDEIFNATTEEEECLL